MTNTNETINDFFTEPVPETIPGDPYTQEGMIVSSEPVDPAMLLDNERIGLGM